jgi:hypothetical protein
MEIFAVPFLPQLAAGNYPTQAKRRLEWGTPNFLAGMGGPWHSSFNLPQAS